MKLSKLMLFVVPLVLAACGNNNSSGGPTGGQGPQDSGKPKDLSSFSLADVLSTKYDSAVLNCNLWARMRGPLFITDTPDDTASIDLIKDSTFPKTISLSGKSDLHSLQIQIKVSDIRIERKSGYSNNYGEQYSYTNSPAVFGEYSGQSSTMYPQGYVGGQFQGNSLIINENIVSQLVAQSGGPQGESSPTVDYVECSVVTKVKAAYKDQWKHTSVGNPPTCLLGQPIPPAECMIRRN